MDCPATGELGKSGRTRRELAIDVDADEFIPDPGPLAYLLPRFLDLGVVEYQAGLEGRTAVPLPFREIMAWPGVRHLLPCEIQTLRSMSAAAASAFNSTSNEAP